MSKAENVLSAVKSKIKTALEDIPTMKDTNDSYWVGYMEALKDVRMTIVDSAGRLTSSPRPEFKLQPGTVVPVTERKIVDYDVANGLDVGPLRERVKEHLALGYVPLGGVCMGSYTEENEINTWYGQAMVKYES